MKSLKIHVFFILSLPNNETSGKSPFAVFKALQAIGEPKSVKKRKSGDLLIETNSAVQSKSYLSAKTFLDSPLLVTPHKSLNSSRGVISEPDLLHTSEAEILEGFSDQGVVQSLQLINPLHQLRQNSPSTSSVTVASPSKSPPPHSVIDTAPTTSNSLSISAASSSSTACSVLETTTTTSNTIPTIFQETTQTSKPRRKKRPPKNQSNTKKPIIEIKTASHRPRKFGPTEYTTDEEDMIIYDARARILRFVLSKMLVTDFPLKSYPHRPAYLRVWEETKQDQKLP
ncbi:putative RNA-directed DNA polymerase from transposon BS [Trichonephila clavipes]|nr:putative RNA-directed DNA polymerase from transposon BS [Trichonephila clavipes]